MIAFRSGVSRLNKVVKAFEKAASELELAQTQIQEEIDQSYAREDEEYAAYIAVVNAETEKRGGLWTALDRAKLVRKNIVALVGA